MRVTLPDLFEAQVARTPDSPSVQMADEVLTYQHLNARANQLARYLVQKGAGPESIVALALPRSVDQIVAVWAILKAGAIYLPIDTAYPAERISYMLRDAQPRLVLSTAPSVGTLSTANLVDADRTAALAPEHPAYAIYTSGSTGAPKAVVMPGAALVNLMEWYLPSSQHGRVAQFAAISFDVATMEILTATLSGGCLVIPDDEVRRDASKLCDWLTKYEVNELFAPNLLLQSLCEAALSAGSQVPSLRHVGQGGEALTLSAAVRRFHASTGRRLDNHYGPTETHLATAYTLNQDVVKWPAEPPIGQPITNMRAYVLDDGLQKVATGQVGELYLAGVQLARGYLRRPGLTATRFVANPFERSGSRMYRTGDLVRERADGELVFVGRVDHQVKVRGFRVELGEIEGVLRRHPEVRQVAVNALDGPAGSKRLVAYVVPAKHSVEPAVLRAHAAVFLPDYMIPTTFVELAALPLSPNGKLDRSALPAPVTASHGRPAKSPTERALCQAFTEVLGVPAVGVDDEFLTLGGHSLAATKLAGRIRSLLGLELPVRLIFELETPARLATALDSAERAGPRPRPRARPDRIPLSFGQRRLWFLHCMEGPNAAYNIPLATRLRGPLDRTALAAALDDVLMRHESLRTLVGQVDGEPVQRVQPGLAGRPVLSIERIAERELAARLLEAASLPFDLATDLPLRAWLFLLRPGEQVLLLSLHHVAADGWSMRPLRRDLAMAYEARRNGAPPAWTPLPVQYVDYTLWQRERLEGAPGAHSPAGELAFWTQTLSHLPVEIALPRDRPRPRIPSQRGGAVAFELSADLHRGLARLAGATGTTIFMVLHAGLVVLLARLGAGPDIPIGTPVAGRHDPVLDELVGFFVDTLVLRVDAGGNPRFVDLLAQVRSKDLAAFSHQEFPFERIVEQLNPPRVAGRQPLFQVMLSLNTGTDTTLELPGLTAEPEPVPVTTTRMDLIFTLWETYGADGAAAGIHGELQYATDLFDGDTATSLVDRYRRLLTEVLRDPAQPIGQIDILDPVERAQLLPSPEDYADESARPLVHELIEAQARRTPGATAVTSAGECLSYRELNAQANQLARELVRRGVGPETRVAVMLPPSIDLVVALVAVLKAGGAYVPIDPHYPQERIGLIIVNAEPSLLVTTAELAQRFGTAYAPVVTMDTRDWSRIWPDTDLSDQDRRAPLRPRHASYVIYTSGSTGRPKGVVVEHRSLAAYVHRARTAYPGIDGTTLLHSSIAFDLTITSLYPPLTCGACVRIGDLTDPSPDPAPLTFMKVTPSHLQLLEATASPVSPDACLVVGGEVLPPGLLAGWRSRHPGVVVVNAYGPTEATVNCAEHRWDPSEPSPTGPVPVGVPYPGVRMVVLGDGLQPVPAGVAGELYVAGDCLARGYQDSPAMTAERFVADPFGPPGSRMYRTGDMARRSQDGSLVIIGRADDQVKIRGFRVEPAEVETALAMHPAVEHVAVVAREFEPGDLRLVAYLVTTAGAGVEVPQLRRYLAGILPSAFIPAAFVVLDRLPLTSNGKLDRAALPRPSDGVLDSSGSPAPIGTPAGREPRGGVEETMCAVFAEVLDVPEVRMDSSFFDLGGHSLLAVQLTGRIAARLGIRYSINDVLAAPTPAGLLSLPSAGGSQRALSRLLRLRTGGRRRPLFCIHPAVGVAWGYAGLCSYVNPDRGIYGLQARALAEPEYAPTSPEEAIDDYLTIIRAVQPEGPYHLLGWSLGGLIAHSLAVRLQRSGAKVGLLGLLDSYPPAEVREYGAPTWDEEVVRQDIEANLRPTMALDQGASLDIATLARVYASLTRIFSQPSLGVFDGDMVLWTAENEAASRVFHAEAWRRHLTGVVDQRKVRCRHWEMTSQAALAQIGPSIDALLKERP